MKSRKIWACWEKAGRKWKDSSQAENVPMFNIGFKDIFDVVLNKQGKLIALFQQSLIWKPEESVSTDARWEWEGLSCQNAHDCSAPKNVQLSLKTQWKSSSFFTGVIIMLTFVLFLMFYLANGKNNSKIMYYLLIYSFYMVSCFPSMIAFHVLGRPHFAYLEWNSLYVSPCDFAISFWLLFLL